MEITDSFKEFLKEIRLPETLREEAKLAHEDFRERIESDESLKSIIVDTFLQGSYRRNTGVKPEDGEKADVDIVVVTSLDRKQVNARAALNKFKPFLEEHYKDAYKQNDRSWAISVGNIKLDLVPTSAPSEALKNVLKEVRKSGASDNLFGSLTRESFQRIQKAAGIEDWKNEVLWIPDRNSEKWDETNPLEQIAWTFDKSASTNGHYVRVVKATKWWRSHGCDGKYPKGYPLEHLVGQNCPDGISNVAEGFTRTLEQIITKYAKERKSGGKPYLLDHGVSDHDVFERIDADQFAVFYDAVSQAAVSARAALDNGDKDASIILWRAIFGDVFPQPNHKKTASTAPAAPPILEKANFA